MFDRKDKRKQLSHSIACCSPQTNLFGPYVRLFGLGIVVEVSVRTYVGHPYIFSSASYLFIEENTHLTPVYIYTSQIRIFDLISTNSTYFQLACTSFVQHTSPLIPPLSAHLTVPTHSHQVQRLPPYFLPSTHHRHSHHSPLPPPPHSHPTQHPPSSHSNAKPESSISSSPSKSEKTSGSTIQTFT